jgi:hypothetical protein
LQQPLRKPGASRHRKFCNTYQDYEQLAVRITGYGLPEPAAEALEQAGDLRTYDASLPNRDIRIIVNQNDFLLTDGDLAWSTTFLRNNWRSSRRAVTWESSRRRNNPFWRR